MKRGNSKISKALQPGTIYKNKSGLEYEIIGIEKEERRKNPSGDKIVKHVRVRFVESGYETVKESSGVIRGFVKDNYQLTIKGVACFGDADSNPNHHPKLYSIYSDMINRCYEPKDSSYSRYGGIGVKVSDRWLNYNNFINDAIKLPNFDIENLGRGKLVLDKDTLQMNIPASQRVYSKDTCLFIEEGDNSILANTSPSKLKYDITFTNMTTNEKFNPNNRKDFCKDNSIPYNRLYTDKNTVIYNNWLIEKKKRS